MIYKEILSRKICYAPLTDVFISVFVTVLFTTSVLESLL